MSDTIACLALTVLPVIAVFWATTSEDSSCRSDSFNCGNSCSPPAGSRGGNSGNPIRWAFTACQQEIVYDDLLQCVSTCTPCAAAQCVDLRLDVDDTESDDVLMAEESSEEAGGPGSVH